MSYAAGDR